MLQMASSVVDKNRNGDFDDAAHVGLYNELFSENVLGLGDESAHFQDDFYGGNWLNIGQDLLFDQEPLSGVLVTPGVGAIKLNAGDAATATATATNEASKKYNNNYASLDSPMISPRTQPVGETGLVRVEDNVPIKIEPDAVTHATKTSTDPPLLSPESEKSSGDTSKQVSRTGSQSSGRARARDRALWTGTSVTTRRTASTDTIIVRTRDSINDTEDEADDGDCSHKITICADPTGDRSATSVEDLFDFEKVNAEYNHSQDGSEAPNPSQYVQTDHNTHIGQTDQRAAVHDPEQAEMDEMQAFEDQVVQALKQYAANAELESSKTETACHNPRLAEGRGDGSARNENSLTMDPSLVSLDGDRLSVAGWGEMHRTHPTTAKLSYLTSSVDQGFFEDSTAPSEVCSTPPSSAATSVTYSPVPGAKQCPVELTYYHGPFIQENTDGKTPITVGKRTYRVSVDQLALLRMMLQVQMPPERVLPPKSQRLQKEPYALPSDEDLVPTASGQRILHKYSLPFGSIAERKDHYKLPPRDSYTVNGKSCLGAEPTGTLYDPVFIRRLPTDNDNHGWCDMCGIWLQLRNHSYAHHFKSKHGVSQRTKTIVPLPKVIRGGEDGDVHCVQGYCELCECWFDLHHRKGGDAVRWQSWYIHQFQAHHKENQAHLSQRPGMSMGSPLLRMFDGYLG